MVEIMTWMNKFLQTLNEILENVYGLLVYREGEARSFLMVGRT